MTTNQKRVSLRACIDANCRSCIYDPTESGSWRKQVENCTVIACYLHPVRPKTKKKSFTNRNKNSQNEIKGHNL